jgi:hypothetical protein
MCAQMSSPGDKQPPKEWWLENACRIAAFRLRSQKYMGVNVTPLREQIRDTVEFVRVVWEEIERHMREEEEP